MGTISYTGKQIDENISKFYNCLNTVIVKSLKDCIVTINKDTDTINCSKIIEDTDYSYYILYPNDFGIWTIISTKPSENDISESTNENIDTITTRNIELINLTL